MLFLLTGEMSLPKIDGEQALAFGLVNSLPCPAQEQRRTSLHKPSGDNISGEIIQVSFSFGQETL